MLNVCGWASPSQSKFKTQHSQFSPRLRGELKRLRRFHVLLRVAFEFVGAVLRAEIIVFAVVMRLGGRVLLIDLHSTYRIGLHVLPPFLSSWKVEMRHSLPMKLPASSRQFQRSGFRLAVKVSAKNCYPEICLLDGLTPQKGASE
jgi:hypothetical protein